MQNTGITKLGRKMPRMSVLLAPKAAFLRRSGASRGNAFLRACARARKLKGLIRKSSRVNLNCVCSLKSGQWQRLPFSLDHFPCKRLLSVRFLRSVTMTISGVCVRCCSVREQVSDLIYWLAMPHCITRAHKIILAAKTQNWCFRIVLVW